MPIEQYTADVKRLIGGGSLSPLLDEQEVETELAAVKKAVTSKKTKKKEAPTKSFSALKNSLIMAAKKEFGASQTLTTSEFEDMVFGVDLQGLLPLQYVFGCDVIPLDSILTLVGPPATTKSGTAIGVFGRKFMENGGLVAIVETETKVSPDYFKKLIRNEKWYDEQFIFMKAHNVDDVFERSHYIMDWHKQNCPDIPLLLIIDSFGMIYTKEILTKMEKTGEADKTAGMRNAGALNSFMRKMISDHIPQSNTTVLVVNHQKESCANIGGGAFMPPQKTESGGTTKEFAWPLKIETSKGKTEKNLSGIKHFHYKVTKNSFGNTRRTKLDVPRFELLKDEDHEEMIYDWDAALAYLIVDGMEHDKTEINKIVDVISDSSNKVFKSKYFGVEGKTASEMGKLIHDDPKAVEALQRVWGIKHKRKVKGEMLEE